MNMTTKLKAEIIPFRRRVGLEDEPEIALASASVASASAALQKLSPSALDLTGQSKAWFLVGPNGSGKTALARWMGWNLSNNNRGVGMAALDPQNRSLATWFQGVAQPDTNDGAQTARWLSEYLDYLMEQKASAILDFGGGDTALAKMVHEVPDLCATMTAAGIAPVACYMIGPRVEDLASLDALEQGGFQPPATVIVLNEGRVDSTLSRDEAFARVLRHSAFKRALGRGAQLLWMPRLEPEVAAEIEGKRLTFGQARDGLVPAGAAFAPIGGFKRSMVRRWLESMEHEFAPVASWMP
jgi:hypothetical protein